ncbi:MAG: CBS domain-containing protein [Phycisphaerae bacterium]
MTRSLDRIDADSTLKEAAMMMEKNDDGCLAVVENGQITGVITDRDIVIRGVASGANPSDMQVRHVMTENVITCRFDSDVNEAAHLMDEKKVRRLIVKDANDIPVGVISLGDVAARAHQQKLSGEVLEDICKA